ncbi:cutinase-domain-containing protein [Morchella snyderi]|nr:cutinase-domain-containing protein [Morchella snyderi]
MAPPSFFVAIFHIALVTVVHAIPAPYWSPGHSEQPPTNAKLETCPYPHPSSGIVEEPVTPNPHSLDLNTADDLINNLCAEIILIFARGTGNSGNIGTSLGYPLFDAMRGGLNQTVIAQGVLPYPAKAIGYLKGGSTEGVNSMVTLAYKARCQCPNSGLVLAGFSQGAQVLRRTISHLPAPLADRVVAVLSFSDSKFPLPLPKPWDAKHISLCQKMDWICDKNYTALSGRHYSALYIPFLGVVVEQLRERIRLMQEGREKKGDEGEGEDFCNFKISHAS